LKPPQTNAPITPQLSEMKKSIIFATITVVYILVVVASCRKSPVQVPKTQPEPGYSLHTTGSFQTISSDWIQPSSWVRNETSVPIIAWTNLVFKGSESEQVLTSTALVYGRLKQYHRGLNVNSADPVPLPIEVAYVGDDGTTGTEKWVHNISAHTINITVQSTAGRFVGSGGQRQANEFKVILLRPAEIDFLRAQGYQNGELHKISYSQICKMLHLAP
jgi:hypothetical protein